MKKIKTKKNGKNIAVYTRDGFDETKLKGYDKQKKDKKNEKTK